MTHHPQASTAAQTHSRRRVLRRPPNPRHRCTNSHPNGLYTYRRHKWVSKRACYPDGWSAETRPRPEADLWRRNWSVEQFPTTKLPSPPIELRTTSRHPGDMPRPPCRPPGRRQQWRTTAAVAVGVAVARVQASRLRGASMGSQASARAGYGMVQESDRGAGEATAGASG
jgi:hypothetical protein